MRGWPTLLETRRAKLPPETRARRPTTWLRATGATREREERSPRFILAPRIMVPWRPRSALGQSVMTLTIEAVYKNGVLEPKQPLMLTEGAEVRLTVTPVHEDDDPLGAVIGIGEGVSDGADHHDKYIYGSPRT